MKGSTEPRIFPAPLRELTESTSLGFAFDGFCRDVCGTELLPWQRWLGIHALEIEGDLGGEWSFRWRTVCVLVARQNGKTEFLKLLTLFFMYVLGSKLAIGTAQNLDIAEEVWAEAVDTAETTPALASEIASVSRRNGARALNLEGGERYKVVAASRKGGRGLSADLVSMDELREQQNWDAWGAVTKTTMARPNAQVWTFSNAGDATSVVLRHLRVQGHRLCGDPDGLAATIGAELTEGIDTDDGTLAVYEWSAPPECPVDDVDAWAMANPSLGYGFLTERALRSAMATDPEAVFRTECLCQWVEARVTAPFPEGAWEAGTDRFSSMPKSAELSFGIDVSANRSMTAIAVCGRRYDALPHIEVVAYRTGFAWVRDWLAKQAPCRVALQARGAPVSSHIDELRSIKGVEVVECAGRDIGAWCGRFYDAVSASVGEGDAAELRHRPQPALDAAAACAQIRALGDGAWGWDRKGSPDDISPLVACTMAYGLAECEATEERTVYRSSYAEGRELVVI